jgi:spore coat protein A
MHNVDLPWGLSCHYHGGITALEHDGYAEDMDHKGKYFKTLIQPGEYWDYVYPNDQPMATNWYHDHCIHFELLSPA